MNKIKLIAASLCTSALIGGAPLLATPVLAEESSKVSKDYVVDNADLLTQTEENELSEKLQDISDELQFDVVVVTTNSIGSKTATEYADDYFDYNGYGRGSNNDGALFLVDMGDRKWAISTSGYGIEAIVDSALDDMEEEIVPYLKSGDYDGAFNEFADLTYDIVNDAKNGKSYSNSTTSTIKNHKNIGTNLIVAFSIGAGISLIIILVYRSKLKPVKFQKEAKEYIVPGSFNLRRSDDVFLYFNITKVPIPKNNDSDDSGSFHSSSSGSSHGGSSGSF
ncbi:MAG: TPM domain-containing protein [Lachnospiraceae bacterium]|nr:TPM domain-containing protein [Lachnospiraceae bacterium]